MQWSRRRFLACGASLAVVRGVRLPMLKAENSGALGGLSGWGWRSRLRPLLIGQMARPRRYALDGDGFLIRNGREFFNRPLSCVGVDGATLLHLPLHTDRELQSVRIECSLYGVVVALRAVTLGREPAVPA